MSINVRRAARALVEATVRGDKEAAQSAGVTQRTIRRWRAQLRTNQELAEAVAELQAKIEGPWQERINDAIGDAVTYLQRSAARAEPGDPQAMVAVTQALTVLNEIQVTWELLKARTGDRKSATPG